MIYIDQKCYNPDTLILLTQNFHETSDVNLQDRWMLGFHVQPQPLRNSTAVLHVRTVVLMYSNVTAEK